jgi:hypothetical protein
MYVTDVADLAVDTDGESDVDLLMSAWADAEAARSAGVLLGPEVDPGAMRAATRRALSWDLARVTADVADVA